MDINNFSDLTGFIYAEYDKMVDSFGITNPSKQFIKFVEKSLKRYSKLYSTPLLQQSKRELQLKVALDTMPHGFIWKFFHQKLWRKCKEVLSSIEEQKKEQVTDTPKVEQVQTLVPDIVKQIEVPRVSDMPGSGQG